ncbi:hypothetical protein [Paraburkholderia humisilvae]|uniref:hypothetical protein n=1 Tax=Paraburkholderia humisilvae TaxID=627669 RepID=UPI0015830FA5|nr:hypothetical protein [Paraburkholderia humisilvae]
MDLSFALRFFTVMLILICIALIALAIPLAAPASTRRAPHPDTHALVASIAARPRARWPGMLTGAGIAFLLVSFALLAAAGCALAAR